MSPNGVRNVLPLLLLLGVAMPAQAGLVDPVSEASIECSTLCDEVAVVTVSVALDADLLREGVDVASCMGEYALTLSFDPSCFVGDDAPDTVVLEIGEDHLLLASSAAWVSFRDWAFQGCGQFVPQELLDLLDDPGGYAQILWKAFSTNLSECQYVEPVLDLVAYVTSIVTTEQNILHLRTPQE